MSKGTTRRTVRVPDRLWDATLARAEREETTVSDVIRAALTEYTERETRDDADGWAAVDAG